MNEERNLQKAQKEILGKKGVLPEAKKMTAEERENFSRKLILSGEKEVFDFQKTGKDALMVYEKLAKEGELTVDAFDVDELDQLALAADAEKEILKKTVQPGFMKKFSGERRDQLAREIREKRRGREIERERKRKEAQVLESLKQELAGLSSTAVASFLNYFKRKKIKTEIDQKEALQENVGSFGDGNLDRSSFNSKIKKEIAIFCDMEKRRWEASPYDKEDVKRLFSEEHLSGLSLEDYVLLLKRFPSEMVTHVTRQGVRDHTGQMWHTKGVDKYHSGFDRLVADGKLRSHWGCHFEQFEKNKAIIQALEEIGLGERWKTKAEASKYLAELTDVSGKIRHSESYSDYNAIHVAAEEVADEFYGSERGNEIFFVFSSNQIASQYYFQGRLDGKDFSLPNDQWIWTNENRGLDLNSGIVFIPGEAEVDPVTGSKYAIGENGEVIKNEEQKKIISDFIMSTDFDDFIKQAMEIMATVESDAEIQIKLELLYRELEGKYNIGDFQLRKNLLSASFVRKAFQNLNSKQSILIEERWLFYKKAEKTITAREFWENKFKGQPGKKPSKVVYYKGVDPTEAFFQWKKQAGLVKNQGGVDMGFPEKKRDKFSMEANQGIERFKSLAKKAIEEYFSEKGTTVENADNA